MTIFNLGLLTTCTGNGHMSDYLVIYSAECTVGMVKGLQFAKEITQGVKFECLFN